MATETAGFTTLRLQAPPTFGGRHEDWEEWSFKMKAYLSVQDSELGALIRGAERAVERNIAVISDSDSLNFQRDFGLVATATQQTAKLTEPTQQWRQKPQGSQRSGYRHLPPSVDVMRTGKSGPSR